MELGLLSPREEAQLNHCHWARGYDDPDLDCSCERHTDCVFYKSYGMDALKLLSQYRKTRRIMYANKCRVCNHEWESEERPTQCDKCANQDTRSISSSFTETGESDKPDEPTEGQSVETPPDNPPETPTESTEKPVEGTSNLGVEGEASATVE